MVLSTAVVSCGSQSVLSTMGVNVIANFHYSIEPLWALARTVQCKDILIQKYPKNCLKPWASPGGMGGGDASPPVFGVGGRISNYPPTF